MRNSKRVSVGIEVIKIIIVLVPPPIVRVPNLAGKVI
jgi:hypothetical protein